MCPLYIFQHTAVFSTMAMPLTHCETASKNSFLYQQHAEEEKVSLMPVYKTSLFSADKCRNGKNARFAWNSF